MDTGNASFIDTALQVWGDGGWVMIPLALISLYIYFQAVDILLMIGRAKTRGVTDAQLESWVRNPEKAPANHAGDVVRFVLGAGYDERAIETRLAEVRVRLLPKVGARITLLSNLVTSAPLMGLLGTVIGMLKTFKGLAVSAGQTVDVVAGGISEALITTQTGLMVAIPGYIMISLVLRKRTEYNVFLTKVESFALQYCAGKKAA